MSDGQLTPLAILLTLILTVSLFLIPSVTHSDFISKSAANYDRLARLKNKVHLEREKQIEFIYNRTVDGNDRENERVTHEHAKDAVRAFRYFSPTQSTTVDTRTLPPYMDIMRFTVATVTRPLERREDAFDSSEKTKVNFSSTTILDSVPRESMSIGQRFKLVESNLDESASDIESDPFDPDNFMLDSDLYDSKLQGDSTHNGHVKYLKKVNHSASSSSSDREERASTKAPHERSHDSLLPFPYFVKKITKSSAKSQDYTSNETVEGETESVDGDRVRSNDPLLNRQVITPENRDDEEEDDDDKKYATLDRETHDASAYEDEVSLPSHTPPPVQSYGKKVKTTKETALKESVDSMGKKKQKVKERAKNDEPTDRSVDTVNSTDRDKKKGKVHKDKKKKLTTVKYPSLRESKRGRECPCSREKAATRRDERQRNDQITDRSCSSHGEERDERNGDGDEDSPLDDVRSELKPQLISPYDLPEYTRGKGKVSTRGQSSGSVSTTSSSTTSTSTSTTTSTTSTTSTTTSTTKRPSLKGRSKKGRTSSSQGASENAEDALLNELSTEYYDHADGSRSKANVNDIILDEVNDGQEINDADNTRKSISRSHGHSSSGERRLNFVNYSTHKYPSDKDVFTTYVPSSSPRYFKSLLVSMRRLPFSSSPLSSSSFVSSSKHRSNYQADAVSSTPDVTSVDSVTLRTKTVPTVALRNGRSNKSNRYPSYENIDPEMIINSHIFSHRDEGELAWMNEPTVDISTSTSSSSSSSSIYYDV